MKKFNYTMNHKADEAYMARKNSDRISEEHKNPWKSSIFKVFVCFEL